MSTLSDRLILHNVMVYSDPEDAVTKLIAEHERENPGDVTLISIGEILNDVEIHDVIEDGTVQLNWRLKGGKRVTNDSQTRLLNRAFYVPSELFNSFHPDDRQYAQQEFWAYLSFALDSFQVKSSSPSFLGLSNGSAPLPLQWRVVRQSDLGLEVPEYYFGSRQMLPLAILDRTAIKGELHTFHNWRVMTDDERESLLRHQPSDQVLVYKRPAGRPIRGVVLGLQVSMFDLSSKKRFHDQELETCFFELARLFDQSIAEILVFVDGERATFASLRNQINSATLEASFDKRSAIKGLLTP